MNPFDHVREIVEQAEPKSAVDFLRECPKCRKLCRLFQGRNSRKWYFSHIDLGECANDQTGKRVMHATRDEAIKGEMFK